MHTDRFADRDMIMRYQWGLGIGHTYSHGICLSTHPSTIPSETHNDSLANLNHNGSLAPADEDIDNLDNPANSELDVLQDEDPFSSSDNESGLGLGLGSDSEEWQDVPEGDDEESLELYNTYHTDY